MTCRMGELREKEIINMKDGARIGYVSDIELDAREARMTALIVYGRLRLFGLLGREPDLVIPWQQVELIGEETVLVRVERLQAPQESGKLANFLGKIGL